MTYAIVLVRGMRVAIGSSRSEKTFESREQPKRFSLETKRKGIMKPTNNPTKNARKFPFVDYDYQTSNLRTSTCECVKRSTSFRGISRNYFEVEENRDFLSNAAIFFALIASALVPIAASVSEMVHVVRTLPLF